MARKRMLDPNIWMSEDFGSLSTIAQLVFIGLFSNADDEGRGRAKPHYLKSILFPYREDLDTAEIDRALTEIAERMSIVFYKVGGNEYYELLHFLRWQRVDKPQESKLPPYGDGMACLRGSSKPQPEAEKAKGAAASGAEASAASVISSKEAGAKNGVTAGDDSANDLGTVVEQSENDLGTVVEQSENDLGTVVEQSENDLGTVVEQSANVRGTVPPNRKEEKRIEEKGSKAKDLCARKAIQEFLRFRKSVNDPLDEPGILHLQKQLAELAATEAEQDAILLQSVNRRWKNVYPLERTRGAGGKFG